MFKGALESSHSKKFLISHSHHCHLNKPAELVSHFVIEIQNIGNLILVIRIHVFVKQQLRFDFRFQGCL